MRLIHQATRPTDLLVALQSREGRLYHEEEEIRVIGIASGVNVVTRG